MITKEELKREVDQLPENLVEEAYSFLKKIVSQKNTETKENNWKLWRSNLEKFSSDFMDNRNQPAHESCHLPCTHPIIPLP